MDEVGLLVKALIREHSTAYELILENRKYLDFANEVLAGDHATKALHALLVCAEHLNECPRNLQSVLHFVVTNRQNNKGFSKTEGYDDQLQSVIDDEDDDDDDDDGAEVQASVLIDAVYYKAYNARVSDIYSQAGRIAAGTVDNPHTKERGPDAATEYIAEEMQQVVVKTPPDVGGELVENMDVVSKYIDSYIIGDTKRVYTGFKHIDQKTLIGKKQPNHWIGILGYTHHGKSLLLMSMIYNMALHGANVMLCPRESSVEDAWMNIVWLHYHKVCPDRPIAEKGEWMREGASVGSEKHRTIKMVEADLREGKTLPGKIVVFNCNSWEGIEERLRLTDKKYHFDVVAVDYFGHLDPEGKKGESDIDKQKRSLRKAAKMSMNGIFNDQSGLVIITPLQANKKGYEEAAKREGDLNGIYESMAAVEWFTQAAQDMDCIMSVWQEGESCVEVEPRQMIVHCLKGRGNMRFKTHRLEINKHTGYVADLGTFPRDEGSAYKGAEVTLDNLSSGEIENVVYTTTKIDTGSWDT